MEDSLVVTRTLYRLSIAHGNSSSNTDIQSFYRTRFPPLDVPVTTSEDKRLLPETVTAGTLTVGCGGVRSGSATTGSNLHRMGERSSAARLLLLLLVIVAAASMPKS